MVNLKIKTNDMVRVMGGKDRGKTGKVIQVFPKLKKVVVEGVNVMTKHIRAPHSREKGQKVQFNGPLDISQVMLVCPACNKPSRIGFSLNASGQKNRICRRCKKEIVKA